MRMQLCSLDECAATMSRREKLINVDCQPGKWDDVVVAGQQGNLRRCKSSAVRGRQGRGRVLVAGGTMDRVGGGVGRQDNKSCARRSWCGQLKSGRTTEQREKLLLTGKPRCNDGARERERESAETEETRESACPLAHIRLLFFFGAPVRVRSVVVFPFEIFND